MVNSVLTNYNSLVALQNLQSTQKQLSDVQNQISTGLKINDASDNAATWAVATTIKSSITNLQQVSSNLSESDSVVGLGVTTANSLTSLLGSITANITSAQESANDPSQIQDAINQQLAQLDTTISSASFQGVNLLNTAGTSNFLGSVNTASDGTSTPSYISVQTHDLSRSTGELSILNGLSVEARGDQLFNGDVTSGGVSVAPNAAQTAEQNSYGTTGSTFSIGDTGSGATANLAANGAQQVALAYTDSTGGTHTLTVNEVVPSTSGTSTVSDLVTALNNDSSFGSLFHADTSSSSGSLVITAANRTQQTGSFAITGLTLNSTATTSTAASSTLTFQDGQALSAGEQFNVAFAQTSSTGTLNKGNIILQVGNGASGTVEAYDSKTNTFTVNVNEDAVSGSSVTGTAIASELQKALDFGSYTDGLGGTHSSPFTAAAPTAGASGTTSSTLQALASGNTLKVTTATLTAGATGNSSDNFSIQTPQTDYKSLLDKVNTATKAVENAASALGSAKTRIETQESFVTTLTNTLQDGVSGLVDADMSAESARLSALQVQQQLGTQALSIANSTPQSILSLFK